MSLNLYTIYLGLALEAINLSSFIQLSYFCHETPNEAFDEIVGNSGVTGVLRNYGWLIVFACVLGILLHLRFYKRKQYSIESFCSKRYLMAAGMLFINVLFTGNSIFSLYGSWANVSFNLFLFNFQLIYLI